MSFINRWQHRLRALFRGDDARRERDEEMAFHLSLDAMHAERLGLPHDEATSAAQRRFGNVTALKEEARSVSRHRGLDSLGQDLRYALRTLRRSPGYAIGAALTLALGVGATTAVFSIFDSAELRSTPYGDAGRLYAALEGKADGGYRTPSYLTYHDWLADKTTWNGAIEGMAFVRGRGTWIDGSDGAERVLVANVSPGFFQIARTAPFIGRTFLPGEETAGSERVAVLSFETWRHFYGSDPNILGRIVSIDSAPTKIIGVMPQRFLLPQWGTALMAATSMWMPIAYIEQSDLALAKRGDHADSRVLIRVAASSDSARAATALAAVASRVATAYPADAGGWTGASLWSVRDAAVGNVGQLLRTLAAAAGLVLLLACVNVANLSFARGSARTQELAVRAALGAGRTRIVRQLLTEGAVVAMAGCGAGILLASTLIDVTRSLAVNRVPGVEFLSLNVPMLAFAVGVSLVAALLASLAPAFRATRGAPVITLRSGTHAASASRGDARIRSGLVVVQFSVALILIVGTSLLVQSFVHANAAPLGYDPVGLLTTGISPPAQYAKADDARTLYETLIDRIAAVPGVSDVGFISATELRTTVAAGTAAPDANGYGASVPTANGAGAATPLYRTTSPGYVRAMGMHMASGHWFTDDDMRARTRFVVSEALAKQLFPGVRAVGQVITARRAARMRADFGQPVTGTIIGVLRNSGGTPYGSDDAELYVPFTLETWAWGTLAIRAANTAATIPRVREAIGSVDPAIPEARASGQYNGVKAMSASLANGIARQRLMLVVIAAFALAALMLAAVGLYSVMSYGVAQRTREVGVRVALGATQMHVMRLVLYHGIVLAGLGVVLGSAGAVAATRLIRSALVGTTTTDFPTYVTAAAVLLGTAAIACYIPARRAARMSPVDAIKG